MSTVSKELFDYLGFGTPDEEDLVAGKDGISLAVEAEKRGCSIDSHGCVEGCKAMGYR